VCGRLILFYLIFSALSFISCSIKIYYHNKRGKADESYIFFFYLPLYHVYHVCKPTATLDVFYDCFVFVSVLMEIRYLQHVLNFDQAIWNIFSAGFCLSFLGSTVEHWFKELAIDFYGKCPRKSSGVKTLPEGNATRQQMRICKQLRNC